MTVAPSWLPATVNCNGVWSQVIVVLYAVFDRDFRQGMPRFQGQPVWWDRKVAPGEKYEDGFWHLITREDPRAGRVPDFRRAERLPWCGPLLLNEAKPEVLVWNYKEGDGQIRTYVWLRDFDYVAILQRRTTRKGHVMFLITAYYVDGNATRKNLERKHTEREA